MRGSRHRQNLANAEKKANPAAAAQSTAPTKTSTSANQTAPKPVKKKPVLQTVQHGEKSKTSSIKKTASSRIRPAILDKYVIKLIYFFNIFQNCIQKITHFFLFI